MFNWTLKNELGSWKIEIRLPSLPSLYLKVLNRKKAVRKPKKRMGANICKDLMVCGVVGCRSRLKTSHSIPFPLYCHKPLPLFSFQSYLYKALSPLPPPLLREGKVPLGYHTTLGHLVPAGLGISPPTQGQPGSQYKGKGIE